MKKMKKTLLILLIITIIVGNSLPSFATNIDYADSKDIQYLTFSTEKLEYITSKGDREYKYIEHLDDDGKVITEEYILIEGKFIFNDRMEFYIEGDIAYLYSSKTNKSEIIKIDEYICMVGEMNPRTTNSSWVQVGTPTYGESRLESLSIFQIASMIMRIFENMASWGTAISIASEVYGLPMLYYIKIKERDSAYGHGYQHFRITSIFYLDSARTQEKSRRTIYYKR